MPLQEIPSFKSKASSRASIAGAENLPDPFRGESSGSSGTKIALRTEEEQQAAAREREEQERAAMAKEIQDRREARRKSLANRRVSFAAEATLHTFQEVEYMQDSTTSTDSTRTASSVAAHSPAPPQQTEQNDEEASDTPSTPPEQVEEIVADSPEDQRELHQKKRRRSSLAMPQDNFGDQSDDETMASTVYDSDSDEGDDVAEVQTEASNSDSDSDIDGTLMTVEAEEMTSASLASTRYGADDGETSSSLDGALREAARRAVNQAREPDEDEEVIPGFVGWGKNARQRQQRQVPSASQEGPPSDDNLPSSSPLKSSPLKEAVDNTEAGMDMDMTIAEGGIIKPGPPSSPAEDMSMDVTNVYGGILSQPANHSGPTMDDESVQDGQTMEFTTAVGSIHRDAPSDADLDHQSDEEMSMELTSVMGQVLGARNKRLQDLMQHSSSPVKDINEDTAAMDLTMDMTCGVGRILPINSQTQEHDAESENNMDMDVTTAVGNIIRPQAAIEDRTIAKKLMEQEVDQPETTNTDSTPIKSPARKLLSSAKKDLGDSPGLAALIGKGLRRSNGPVFSATPQLPAKGPSTTPSSQRRTRSQGPASPSRSPVLSTSRTPSPERRALPSRSASPKSKATPRSSTSSTKLSGSLFQQDSTLPLVVLTPQRPKLSGVGIDRSGIGSPRVTEIMDRRGSIGDSAAAFSPIPILGQRKTVAFEDPRAMEEELDRERRDDEGRESGRSILEKEADGGSDDHETTLNLKEMIQGLSPKKMPFKGRKSLHVGSARGVLGKRPTELDEDSDAEEQDGVKRLKGLQGSPVKNIRLQQPPSKAETTGSRATISRLDDDADNYTITPSTSRSPQKVTRATTPKDQTRFKDIDDDQPTNTINFNATPSANIADLQPSEDGRIHLQHFLNMTSIRFMELTTTKRRHTVMPSARKGSLSGDIKEDISFEKCVVAGACTIPMLELFQHSCRELKKYISEGRRIVREIETETFQENPPLFHEYINATPEFKALMDNQFKNVKTHAKLLSKAGWYEWRMKLQEGLREGLIKTAEGMAADEKFLDKQQKLLSSVLPTLTKHFEALTRECENLDEVATELEDCDPAELDSARSDLVGVEDDIEAKTQELAQLREQLQETEQTIEHLAEQKRSCQADIKEAEKVREDCRGWSSTEIGTLKAKVDALEKEHGWAITGVHGTGVSMTYRREIELVFDAAAFKAGQPISRIDLWYVATTRDHNQLPATLEREFCLQCIRDHVRGLVQSATKVSRMLKVVSMAWDRANALANQVYQLNFAFPTSVVRTSDSSLAIRSSLLLAPLQTKVEVVMDVRSSASHKGLGFQVSSQAGVVYGEQFNAGKMAEFLSSRISDHVLTSSEKEADLWYDVVSALHGKLLARGKK